MEKPKRGPFVYEFIDGAEGGGSGRASARPAPSLSK